MISLSFEVCQYDVKTVDYVDICILNCIRVKHINNVNALFVVCFSEILQSTQTSF